MKELKFNTHTGISSARSLGAIDTHSHTNNINKNLNFKIGDYV